MYDQIPILVLHPLEGGATFFTGRVPEGLLFGDAEKEALWALRPKEPQFIVIHGMKVEIPRRNQAFGADYHFSGQTNRADTPSASSVLGPGGHRTPDDGILVNWYDGALGHYIGVHRDSTKHMCPGAPIVTVSLGASRTFRIRRWKGREHRDFQAEDGALFILPYDTNRTWTHEVLHRNGDQGQRISVTLRAFDAERTTRTTKPEKHSPNHT